MTTRARITKRLDVRRLALAMRAPGADPRTWITTARVEGDGAVRWDPALGWIVDVRPHGTELEGEDSLPCKVATGLLGGAGAGEYLPPKEGAEVLVALSAGDPEAEPAIVAYLDNEEDAAPTEVNGLPIEGDSSTDAKVSPFDTEIKVSPHSRREQFAGRRYVQAKQHVLAGDDATKAVLLGSKDAGDSFVKGEELVNRLIDTIDQLVKALGTGSAAGNPVAFVALTPPGGGAFDLFWAKIKAELKSAAVLSERVKGE